MTNQTESCNKSEQQAQQYDCIIVGAGHNGPIMPGTHNDTVVLLRLLLRLVARFSLVGHTMHSGMRTSLVISLCRTYY